MEHVCFQVRFPGSCSARQTKTCNFENEPNFWRAIGCVSNRPVFDSDPFPSRSPTHDYRQKGHKSKMKINITLTIHLPANLNCYRFCNARGYVVCIIEMS